MSGGPRSRIRVLHIIQNLHAGGMEKLLADLVQRIDAKRFESHVLALQYFGRYGPAVGTHASLHLGPPMSRLSLLRPVALARRIAELQPDVVHTHSGVWYKGARASRLAGVRRVVHTEHGVQPEDLVAQFLDRRAARWTDVVVAVSQALRAYLARRLRLPERVIEVVKNGVDVDTFVPQVASGMLKRELHLPPETIIVGAIGRLESVKGYDVCIQAFATVCQQRSARRPVLAIAGEGSARPGLERLVAQLGLGDRVFFLGWRDDVAALYPQFHCFVVSSWSEGTSVSLLEAMACGVAPVVTAVGGNADVLGPELAEQLVNAGDVPAMADRIGRVLDDTVAQQIGLRARRRVERAFNLSQMVLHYQRLYTNGDRVSRLP